MEDSHGQLPNAFVEYTQRLMGNHLFGKFMKGMGEPCPNSIRVNKGKVDDLALLDCLASSRQRVPWCDCGYYLEERPNYTFDPLLHAGYYYVQEASSMFVHSVLHAYADQPVQMLDMCAAPGGKTTAAIGALPEGSLVVSNEPVRQRANILAENVQKWGSPFHIVTCNYPRDYAKSGLMFDIVLCDVPCSGEGMFRKDKGAIDEWSVANVEKCCRLQREIVADAWKCLRQGGLLIYSTCTYNIKENEENVRWISEEFGADILPVDIGEEWGITGSLLEGFTAPVYRFIPGASRGEGLFMAVLRKTGDDYATDNRRMKPPKMKTVKFAHQWLNAQGDYLVYPHKERYIAVPRQIADCYASACHSLSVVSAGVTLGEQKGRDILPNQSLALSVALDANAFPTAELSYEQAISYLRKEVVTINDAERGFVVVKYKGAPLGFVKNIGNRANNLYPQEWKIRN